MVKFNIMNAPFLNAQMRLMQFFDCASEESGLSLTTSFQALADEIGMSYRSLKNYLHEFYEAGILKFNYKSERILLNPDVFKINLSEAEQLFYEGGFKNFVSD